MRRASTSSRRGLLAPALLALALTACGGGGEHAPSTLTWRLLAEEPAERFAAQELYRRVPVAARNGAWKQRDGETLDGDVQLAADERQLVLHRAFDRAADELTVLRVIVEQERRVTLVLQWAGAAEEFDDARRLELEGQPSRRKKERAYTFNLAEHPRWRSEIGRLRLQLKTQPNARLAVKAVREFREQLASERLATALGKGWKVDLGNDVRSAVVTVPGVALERTVTVPEGGLLRFACGLAGGRSEPVTFRVKAGGGGEVVYEQTLDPRTPDGAAAWHDATVDLRRFAGREIPLVFETLALASPDVVAGFPAWANPEIYGAADGAAPLNVVLISIDLLRADRMSLYGNPRPTTQHIDAWAARAAVFEHAVAAAPWTLPSHTSMLSGLNAFHHGVNHSSPAPTGLELLAERLRSAGYQTLAVTGGGFVHPDYGLGQGFDRFRYWGDEVPSGKEALAELANHEPLAEAWLAENAGRPFFLFFHTYEVHHRNKARQPYFDEWSDFPSDYQLRFVHDPPSAAQGFQRTRRLAVVEPGADGAQPRPLPPELAQLPFDFYDSGIGYTDVWIGRLLARLGELGLAERTLVILTSDHGELIGEHGVSGHVYLYDENLMIPLVVAHPAGKGAGQRIAQQVRTVDIVPTVLDVLGLPPIPGVDGASLVPLLDGAASGAAVSFPDEAWSYAAASNYGVSLRVGNRLKYHFINSVWPPINGREQVFDLQQDPGEQRELMPPPAQLEALRQRLRATVEPAQNGPRIALVNDGAAPFAVRLSGPAIRQGNVKSIDLACPCLSWVSRLQVRAEVPAQSAYTLILEDVKPGDELRLFDDQGNELAVYPIAALAAPQRLAQSGGAWRPAADDEAVEREVRVWWHGARQLGAAAPEESNPELREQLEALGYL